MSQSSRSLKLMHYRLGLFLCPCYEVTVPCIFSVFAAFLNGSGPLLEVAEWLQLPDMDLGKS